LSSSFSLVVFIVVVVVVVVESIDRRTSHIKYLSEQGAGWRSQGKERIRASKGHSPPRECRQRVQVARDRMEKSGQGKDLSKQRALTTWRMQTKSLSERGTEWRSQGKERI